MLGMSNGSPTATLTSLVSGVSSKSSTSMKHDHIEIEPKER